MLEGVIMRLLLCILGVFSAVALSKTVVQNDWSGGGGVPGPVFNWETEYNTSTSINDNNGTVRLEADVPEYLISSNFDGAVAVFAADLDSDGDLDVLGAAKTDDEISWWENMGSGTSWNKHVITHSFNGAMSVYACDVDGDGDIDVLGAAKAADDIIWWENKNGSGTLWAEHTIDSYFDGAMFVFAADVDGDNDIDVLGAAKAADDITWWENTNGAGTAWTEHTVDGTFDGAMSVHAADIDGDGDIDVLGAAKSTANDITWWENKNGSGTAWAEHTVDDEFDHANSVCAADVNGDGHTDILGAAEYADEVTWWENVNGSGTVWVEHSIEDDFDAALSIHTADIDSDGDIDVLGAATGGNDIVWWENINGAGTVWAEHVVKKNRDHDSSADSTDTDGRFDSTMAAFAADINGDGIVDILVSSSRFDEITWLEYEYPAIGFLESSILYTGSVSRWNYFTADIVQPPGTTAGFQFRSSASASDMGAWSDTVFSAGGAFSGKLADSTPYIQYRLILKSDLSYRTAYLNSIECTLNEHDFTLTIPQNPVYGTFSPEITTVTKETVVISIYDISGRLTDRLSQEFSPGTHTVHFHGLKDGVYFCVISTDYFFDPQMLVVLE